MPASGPNNPDRHQKKWRRGDHRGAIIFTSPVIASEAKQSRASKKDWIASSQELLAMTELAMPN
jgi:hypothetical protein